MRRRNAGEFPPELEEDLESRFAVLRRQANSRQRFDPLDESLEQQRRAGHFARDRISTESGMPGGAIVHRAAGAAVRRQIDGLLDQMQQFSDAVFATTELLGSMLADPPFHHHDDLRSDLDTLDDRVTAVERRRIAVEAVSQRVLELEHSIERVSSTVPDIDWGQFAATFRGSREILIDHYSPMADRFVGSDPVLDIGCGDGDFLQLLAERGIDCWGVEADEEVADSAIERGLHVRHGDGIEVVRNLGNDSLGGIAVLQVVEHLAASDVPVLVEEAYRTLRAGGVLLLETPDPRSLYVHTHSFWLDPSHVRPVHPLYLEFLCRQAGFRQVEIARSSPVRSEEQLEMVDDDGSELAQTLNANLAKLNEILFGPQDYAVRAVV